MSIVTRTGDGGATGLMFNRRVSKSDLRLDACGAVDELNAALGLARASAAQTLVRQNVLAIQKDLVTLMGELGTLPEDLPRYIQAGFSPVTAQVTAKLDALVKRIESEISYPKDWVMPGGTVNSAALDFARATCRRAERRVCALREAGQLQNAEVLVYLNRLSDTLWLLARWVEAQGGKTS
jgi:cob(I)alamin adenosyltransferase